MKQLLVFFLFIFLAFKVFSQAPQSINFQSVLRNTNGEVVNNRTVSLKISILTDTINFTSVYIETHTKSTDASGLISLQIGSGNALSGVFGNINWGNSAHFIKLEADYSGGNSYVFLGTRELMSVPYAMYASKTDTSSLNLTNRFADKAPISSPTFTGTVSGITKTMVGLSDVDNTTDVNKPVSTATQTALDLKAPISSPTFTGTVSGISKSMVGLSDVDNTTDAAKPVSTATQTALDLKATITALNTKLNISDFPSGSNVNEILYWNGSKWVSLQPGTTGQSIIMSSTGLSWGCIITNTAGSPSSSPSLVVNTALTPITISTTGATGIGAATGLPTGVTASWSNNVITISGTPSLAASFTYTIPLTGGCGSVNATGTITVTVLPCNPSTVTDVDGNSYNTVLIGNQCWTIENLRVRRYNDNTWIQFDASGSSSGSTSNTWNGITVGAHTIYAHDSTTNNPSNLTKYGYLYNWYAAAGIITTGGSPTKNICPLNWHVPTIDEWNTLIDYIGGTNGAGSKMKSTSSLWTSQSPVPNNSTGFTVLPGGHRFTNSAFSGIGTNAYFWSSTAHPSDVRYALTKSFIYNSGNVVNTDYGYGGNKFVGSSIRCIRNSNLTTTSIGSITSTGASSGGNFTFDDGATITARGVVWSTSSGPTVSLSTKTTDGTGTGTFTSTISGLSASTTYYVRAYATNTAGTAYGNEVTFITTCTLNTAGAASSTPTLNAYSALTPITISTTGATGIGTPTGLPTGVSASWAANTIAISGIPSVTGTFTYTIPLTGGCGSGVNATGTITVNVFTCATNSFSDIDGNTYNTVSIGNQCWMSENLKTSRYRNGDLIPIVTDNTAWGTNLQTAQTGKRSWYNNDSTTYENRYGNLYNWYAVVDSRGLCPTGWHVSSDDEWKTLTGINGVGVVEPGKKLKSTVTNSMQGSGLGWDPGNPGTDNYGFSAFPGGLRSKEGVFNSIRTDAFFWCATQSNTTTAWGRFLLYNNTNVYDHDLGLKEVGASVRCLKD